MTTTNRLLKLILVTAIVGGALGYWAYWDATSEARATLRRLDDEQAQRMREVSKAADEAREQLRRRK